MNNTKRYKILSRFYEKNPYPTTELIYNSNFELLYAVVLSQRTADIKVNNVTNKLFLIANTPQKMLELGIEGIKYYIKTIGLYNKKAKNIIEISKILLENYKGIIPNNRKQLENLPGIGRKTANIILNIIFKQTTIAVDTHVFRFSNRTGFAIGNNVNTVEKKLIKIVPTKFKLHCHYWFLLHGKYICIARKPKCNFCIIKDLCEYDKKN